MKKLSLVLALVVVSQAGVDQSGLFFNSASAQTVGEVQITRGIRASQFIQSIGVNTHAATIKNGYKNSSLIISSLNYLGINHVRDGLPYDGQGRKVVEALADAGVKFDFVPSRNLPELGPAGMARYISSMKAFETRRANSIYGIEGLNEANAFSFSYNGEWSMPAAAGFQRYLYSSVKATPLLRNAKVINTSLAYRVIGPFQELGDLTNYTDAANAHVYTQTGATPDRQVEGLLSLARINAPFKPMFITEMGHPTVEDSGLAATTFVQAKLTLTELFSAWENGARRIYIYELFDNYTGEERGEKEANFGLFYKDGSPKLAASSLRNLMTILSHSNTGSVDGVLKSRFSLQTPTAADALTIHAMSLEKSDTSYNIAVWSDQRLRGGTPMTDLDPKIVNTVVKFGHLAKKVRIYDPVLGIEPFLTNTNVSQVTFPVKDRPLIIEVDVSTRVQTAPYVSAINAAMTASQLVAQINKLASSARLRTIALTDTNVLPVSSQEAVKYMIANYKSTLAKIVGEFSFIVSYENATLRKTSYFAESGALTRSVEYSLQNGRVVQTKITGAGGTVLIYDANGNLVSRTVAQH